MACSFRAESSWADSDEDTDSECPQAAGEALSNLIIDLKTNGTISAKTACILAWHAHFAGATGFVDTLKFRPNCKATGHYSRHWDYALGTAVSNKPFYNLETPVYERANASRTVQTIPVYPPHEILSREFEQNKVEILEKLEEAKRDALLPPCYFDNPVVKSAPDGEPALPLAIYFDGVSFTRTDQVLAFWVYKIPTISSHHCCIVLRKSEMCRCGCRKW